MLCEEIVVGVIDTFYKVMNMAATNSIAYLESPISMCLSLIRKYISKIVFSTGA